MGDCCSKGSRGRECCSNEKCGSSCYSNHDESCGEEDEEEHEEFTHHLIEAADCAWMEVLKDKIKEHILATQGDRMAELAKIVSEANNQRWKHKMEKKQGCMSFREKLCRFFEQYKK